MSNYAKLSDFAIKDSLTTGDPDKVVKGEELDDEFNAISTAIATKADSASPSLTGTPTAPTAVLNTNTTQIATTAFVVAEIADGVSDERTATATLTNKTLTSPVINGGSLTEITSLTLEGTTADAYETTIASEPTADRTITLPDATTTLVGTDTTQTLTNKTINGSQLVNSSVTPAKLTQPLTQGTAQASTTGTAIDFTGIPSWAKRITVMFAGVSISGTDDLLVQVGDAGGFETTDYVSSSSTGGTDLESTSGFVIRVNSGSNACSGLMTLCSVSGNTWVSSHAISRAPGDGSPVGGGSKTLSDTLTQVRVTTTGSNTFDAGSINIMYE